MKLIDKIKKEMRKPLSDSEVLDICDNKASLVPYTELRNYDNIDEVLGPHGACIILYQTKEHFGHWCCMFKAKKNLISFFDPYGYKLDDELDFIPEHFREESGQNYPLLTYLIYNSPYKVEYNEHQFQEDKSDVSTCGRWCGFRLRYRKVPLKEFWDGFKKFRGLNLDYLITALTMEK